jgi:hypothetical protein
MLPQVAQHGTDAPQNGELFQDQPDDMLDLFVGIELQFSVRPDDIARRLLSQPFAATAPIQTAGLHALLELVQLEAPHEAFERQNHPIIEIVWMIQAIFVGEQGVECGADSDQVAAVLIFTSEAIDLKAEDQPGVIEGDFGQQPGEIVAADPAGTGSALIAIEDTNAFRGPAPYERTLSEVGLDLSRFGMALSLLGMRLSNIDQGPPFEVARLDFVGAGRGEGISGIHRPPPFRRLGRGLAGGAGSSGSEDLPGTAALRDPTAASWEWSA